MVFVIPAKYGCALRKYLPVGGELYLRLLYRFAHGVEINIIVSVNTGYAGYLGLTVNLLQIDPDGMEKPENVRAKGRASRVCRPDSKQPEPVLERPENCKVADIVKNSEDERRTDFFKFTVGVPVADGQEKVIEEPFQPGSVENFHLHGGGHVLPDSRRRKHLIRAYFANILLHRLGLFGEVHGKPHEQGTR